MSNVTIDTAKGPISVNVAVNSQQVVGMTITVYASDGVTPLEHYLSDSKTNNPYNITLPNPPASYKGCYVCATFIIVDPVGAGTTYTIVYSIMQSGAAINPTNTVTGTTAVGQISRFSNFQLQ
jgi:hypothetical protein